MSVQLCASFDSRDRADLALARLKGKGIAFRVHYKQNDGVDERGFPLADYCANILFPYQPVNLTTTDSVTGDHRLGMRAILPFETMGLNNGESRGGEVTVRLSIDSSERDTARAILLNSGGYHVV